MNNIEHRQYKNAFETILLFAISDKFAMIILINCYTDLVDETAKLIIS